MSREFFEQTDIQKLRRKISRYMIGRSTRYLSDYCMLRLAGHVKQEIFSGDAAFPLPDLPDLGDFYSMTPDMDMEERVSPSDVLGVIQHLVENHRDGLLAYALLAEIYKRRLRFAHILSHTQIPSAVELGHRSLIEFGNTPKEISDQLRLRKMLYDIDNRSAQESAFLYMKIMASVLGGEIVHARNSPILRDGSSHFRRSVDCIAGRRAYDFKARMTDAPSRRARFQDEMSFARDCFVSGYTPVLLVLNQLPGQRPVEMIEVFERYEGEVYIGDEAWDHVREVSGTILSKFLDRFVHPRTNAVSRETGPLSEDASPTAAALQI